MEETTTGYGGCLRKYFTRNIGKWIRAGVQAWGLHVGLMILYLINYIVANCYTEPHAPVIAINIQPGVGI
jgi:hypothetical protein